MVSVFTPISFGQNACFSTVFFNYIFKNGLQSEQLCLNFKIFIPLINSKFAHPLMDLLATCVYFSWFEYYNFRIFFSAFSLVCLSLTLYACVCLAVCDLLQLHGL